MKVPVKTSFINNIFEDVQQGFVGCLILVITLWVVLGGPTMLDMKCGKDVTHMLFLEMGTIINNDG